MSINDELSLIESDWIKHGGRKPEIERSKVLTRGILARHGFSRPEEVRRIADRYGRRVKW